MPPEGAVTSTKTHRKNQVLDLRTLTAIDVESEGAFGTSSERDTVQQDGFAARVDDSDRAGRAAHRRKHGVQIDGIGGEVEGDALGGDALVGLASRQHPQPE
jgi:hypothetical protein